MTTLGLRDLAFLAAGQASTLSRIIYTPSQITSNITTVANQPPIVVGTPVPYSTANNVNDVGWIIAGGGFTVDMGAALAVTRAAFYCSFGGASRGATLNIKYSTDGTSFTTVTQWNYTSTNGGGFNDIDSLGQFSSARTDCGGWYGVSFNATQIKARYWRIDFAFNTVTHTPRTAEMWLFGYS